MNIFKEKNNVTDEARLRLFNAKVITGVTTFQSTSLPPVRYLKSFIAIAEVAANTTTVAIWSITFPVDLHGLTDWTIAKSLQKSTIININSGSFSQLWFIVLTLL